MRNLKNQFNIKLAIFIFALFLSITLILINRKLINDIRIQTNIQANQLKTLIGNAINNNNQIILSQYNEIIAAVTFPIIIANQNQQECYYANLNDKKSPGILKCNEIIDIMNDMDSNFIGDLSEINSGAISINNCSFNRSIFFRASMIKFE